MDGTFRLGYTTARCTYGGRNFKHDTQTATIARFKRGTVFGLSTITRNVNDDDGFDGRRGMGDIMDGLCGNLDIDLSLC